MLKYQHTELIISNGFRENGLNILIGGLGGKGCKRLTSNGALLIERSGNWLLIRN